jgi:hypothetical protein
MVTDSPSPKLLELFCGGKSVGKAAKKFGYEVTSVDILPKFEPDYCCDILDFDYKQFPVGYFAYIHASPPCTEFSFAKTVGTRKIEEASAVVSKAIEIIEYLQPKFFCIENPLGWLRYQEIMAPLAKYLTSVCYCKYGFKYKKSTDLWTNVPYGPRRRCLKGSYCQDKERYGVHSVTVQEGKSSRCTRPHVKSTRCLTNRYAIPEELLDDLLCHDIIII